MKYLEWNDRLAAKFFTPANQDKRVYLFVTKEVLGDVRGECENGLVEFVAALKQGPAWTTDGGICKKADEALDNWRRRNLTYPPYIAYLALFALAAGIEGHFAVNAYYPRLRTLLGETPVPGTYPGFATMRTLWEDLEEWTQHDLRGRLGVFQADVTSHFVHVGLPIAQTILNETERMSLPSIFASGGLDPASTPSDSLLMALLLKNRENFRSRTVQILAAKGNHEEEFATLMEAVTQELAVWDGAVHEEEGEAATDVLAASGGAALWCEHLDDVAKTIQMRLLCRTRHEFPEEGIELQIVGQAGVYHCDEYWGGWSKALYSDNRQILDASTLDWRAGARLRDEANTWRFSLPTSPVRLMINAAAADLGGFIEAHSIPPDAPFLLLVWQEHQDLIEQWGRDECVAFKQIQIRAGLPAGWGLYSAERAVTDHAVRNVFTALSLPHTARIAFRGGLCASANTYFPFALPEVLVTGVPATAVLFCNGKPVGPCTGPAFKVPDGLSTDGRLAFEVMDGRHIICRKSLYTDADFLWPQATALVWCDPRGRQTTDVAMNRAAGPLVIPLDASEFSDWVSPGAIQVSTSAGSPSGNATEDEPILTFVSEAELRRLISEWKAEVEDGVAAQSPGSIGLRDRGSALTEGATQYLLAVRGNLASKNWNRAIGEFTRASCSADRLVSAIAKALLQLACYRSGRPEDAVALGHEQMPPNCARLQSFMTLLAGLECPAGLVLSGIGISDISTFAEDGELEQRIFASEPGGSAR